MPAIGCIWATEGTIMIFKTVEKSLLCTPAQKFIAANWNQLNAPNAV